MVVESCTQRNEHSISIVMLIIVTLHTQSNKGLMLKWSYVSVLYLVLLVRRGVTLCSNSWNMAGSMRRNDTKSPRDSLSSSVIRVLYCPNNCLRSIHGLIHQRRCLLSFLRCRCLIMAANTTTWSLSMFLSRFWSCNSLSL